MNAILARYHSVVDIRRAKLHSGASTLNLITKRGLPMRIATLVMIAILLSGCSRAPKGVRSGVDGFDTATLWFWSAQDTVNVTAFAAVVGGEISIDQPGAAELAWLQKEGCVYSHWKLDEGMTEKMELAGAKTTEGNPIMMVRRIYVCP